MDPDSLNLEKQVFEQIKLAMKSINHMSRSLVNEDTSIINFLGNKLQFTINSLFTNNSSVDSILSKIKSFGVRWWK